MSCYIQFKSHTQKSVQPAGFLGFTPTVTGGVGPSEPVTLVPMKHQLRKERYWQMVKMLSYIISCLSKWRLNMI